MILTLELNPMSDGQHVRLQMKVEGGVNSFNKFNTDLSATLLYEGLMDVVGSAVRGICKELEPRLKRLRNDAISAENQHLDQQTKDN